LDYYRPNFKAPEKNSEKHVHVGSIHALTLFAISIMANNNNVICYNGQQHFLAYYMYYNVNIY